MTTYPGLPVQEVDVVLDYEVSRDHYQGQAEFFIASLHLCGNTGTYIDATVHQHRRGADLASLPLDRLADLDAVIVDAHRPVAGSAQNGSRRSAAAVWDVKLSNLARG